MTTNPQPATRSDKFKSLLGNAAKLAQKQAALTKINGVSLPKVYRDIGKQLAAVKNLPAELVPFREKITQLENSMAAQPEPQKADTASSFTAKAKQFAARASKAVGDTATAVQLQAAYVALGKQAVEKYGEKAIPKGMVDEYRSLVMQRDGLKSEVESLASAPGQGVVTPKRLAIAGVVMCLLLGVAVVRSASSRLFGGRGGVPRDVSDQVAEATSGIGRSLDAINAELERDKSRIETESQNRELQEREIALRQREREMQERERKAQQSAAQTASSAKSTGGGRTAVESKPVVEITNLKESISLLLVDNGSFFDLNINDFRNRLISPSRDFPKGVDTLNASERDAPKSLKDAVAGYKKALIALQKCPVLASLKINEPLGRGRYLANWQGEECVFESTEPSFTSGSRLYVPVTCTHAVSYSHGSRNCSDHPYLLQAGDVTSDEMAQRKKYADDLKDELDALLRAGQWIVYFGVVGLPADASRISDADVTKQVALEGDLPRAKELIEATREAATGTMSGDAPALSYALYCANRSMLTDAAQRPHATDTRIDAKNDRLVLPAASALQWTIWFRNSITKEEQAGILKCLKACGADWDAQDGEGRTPIMHAMMANQQLAIAYLCENGLGVNKSDSEGRTPLMRALMAWDREYVPLMSLSNGWKGVDRDGDSILHYCDRYRHIPVAKAMRMLLEKGASLTVTNNVGDTPMHVLARAAARGSAGRGLDLGEEWNPFVRFLVSKGADGGIKNKNAESPISILVGAGKQELATCLMFPSSIVFEPKNNGLRHCMIALKDKTVLAVSDEGNSRTKVTKRDISGRELASCVIEGELDLQEPDAQAGEADSGAVFVNVVRGNKHMLVIFTPVLKVAYETPALSDIEHVAFQSDGAIVARVEMARGGRYLFKADKSGKVVWSGPEQGPLKGSPEFIEGDREERVWVGGVGGLFAICASQSASHPCSAISFNGEGKELVRSQPFAPRNAVVDLRGVFPDGSILCRDTDDPDEAFLVQPGGKVAWRRRLGTCTSVLHLKGNDVCVCSVAGQEPRLTRIADNGEVVWEAVLQGLGPMSRLQEGKDGVLFASGGDFLSVISASGKVVFVAKHSIAGREEVPRIYDDGTVIWPDNTNGFIVGNYLKW